MFGAANEELDKAWADLAGRLRPDLTNEDGEEDSKGAVGTAVKKLLGIFYNERAKMSLESVSPSPLA